MLFLIGDGIWERDYPSQIAISGFVNPYLNAGFGAVRFLVRRSLIGILL